jgi:Arc/MetJ family transcription regulator
MSRTNIEIDDTLVRKARKLAHLKTKREIVHRALESFVKAEERKAILQYFGSGIWEGNLRAMRRSRV